ncbi:hypothetical protein SH528x_003478 [Novipirellula sp. SH528]|uniref:hypothetical protein n=1 Tax=Novipirellula sp. SH528 TaxID=3454466 RepID=UPI003F9F8EA0
MYRLTASRMIMGRALDGLVGDRRNITRFRQADCYQRKFAFSDSTVISQLGQIYDPVRHGEVIVGESKVIGNSAYIADLFRSSAPLSPFAILVLEKLDGKWFVSDLRVPCEHLSLVDLLQYEIIESLPSNPELASWMPGRKSQSGEVSKLRSLRDARTNERFAELWSELSDQTRSWPWARFLYLVNSIEHNAVSVRQSSID